MSSIASILIERSIQATLIHLRTFILTILYPSCPMYPQPVKDTELKDLAKVSLYLEDW